MRTGLIRQQNGTAEGADGADCMKIIFYRYNSICEPDYIEAFAALGIEVIEEKAEMTDKNIPLETKVAGLGEAILTNRPAFVFSINFFPFISLVCEKLGTIYACVSVDCPVAELFSTQIRNKCNRVFLFDRRQYLDICDENPECIFHMPLGVNADRINGTIGEPDPGREKYLYDISFVGSLYNEKNPYAELRGRLGGRYAGMCDGLLAAQELFPGCEILENAVSDELAEQVKNAAGDDFYSSENCVRNIDWFGTVTSYLCAELTVRDRFGLLYMLSQSLKNTAEVHVFTRSDHAALDASGAPVIFHGGVRTLDEMPLVFRRSRININPTMRAIRSGLPQRIWDVLGSGGFLMTDYQDELPDYFEPGRHLAAYESPEEACELARFYLEHEDIRLEIARNGYELVREKHTVLNRVAGMLTVIFKDHE